MIKIDNINTFGWEAAIRGMRNPLNSWEKSDTGYRDDESDKFYRSLNEELGIDKWRVSLGPNDEKLMKALIKGGPVECKFRRMIHVQMDITAPLYWWKEFDTYKVGTVANSCSTMHKIHAKEFTMDDFSTDHMYALTKEYLASTIFRLNESRTNFISSKCKEDWWQMIQLLPTSYNQKRTVDLSYEVLANIYKHRKGHKLDEWRDLCAWLKSILPYSWIFTEEWEDASKKEPAEKEPKKEEEKNEKPMSERFPWGNDAGPVRVNYAQYTDYYAQYTDYMEKIKKLKDLDEHQDEATAKEPETRGHRQDIDKQAAFELAIIEAVGVLRDRGFSNQGIYNTLLEMFGGV